MQSNFSYIRAWIETPFFSQIGLSGHVSCDLHLVRHSSYTQNGDTGLRNRCIYMYIEEHILLWISLVAIELYFDNSNWKKVYEIFINDMFPTMLKLIFMELLLCKYRLILWKLRNSSNMASTIPCSLWLIKFKKWLCLCLYLLKFSKTKLPCRAG